MAGVKNRRGASTVSRKRYVIGTDKEVKRVQLRGKGKKRFIWMDDKGLFHSISDTELR